MTGATAPFAKLAGISKNFGTQRANASVDLDIHAGQVLALLGENGAGKSTLMKVLYGLYRPDAGEILIEGRPVRFASPRDAMVAGIGMVFQQFTLLPALSVLENLLAAWPRAPWLQSRGRPAVREVLKHLHELAPDLDPALPVRRLSVGQRQLVELVKALNLDARLFILDEPTSVLTPAETERLYGFVRQLAADGKAVVLITHKLADVAACADRIAIMRAGRLVDVAAAAERTPEKMIAAMVGEGSLARLDPPAAPAGKVPKLMVRDVCARGEAGYVDSVSFELVAGEILGIAGVSGNGQAMLADALTGLAPLARGDVVLDGASIAAGGPHNAIDEAVAFVPERPMDNAAVADLDLALNLDLRRLSKLPLFPSRDAAQSRARSLMETFDVRPRQPDLAAGALSGGNLQKLVIARELSGTPAFIVACHPTMGLDVAATQAVYHRLFDHAERGACIVWISEDLDDLLRYAHRIAVMQGGRISGMVARENASRAQLGRWMVGSTTAMDA